MNTNAQLKSYHDHRWLASVKKLVPVINLLSSRPKGDYVDPMVKLVSHLLKHKGEKRAIQLLKLYRLSIQQVVTHQSLTNILFCKTDKDNFPKVLKPWKSLTTGSLESQRLVLSY